MPNLTNNLPQAKFDNSPITCGCSASSNLRLYAAGGYLDFFENMRGQGDYLIGTAPFPE
jgi:hypothetical protein